MTRKSMRRRTAVTVAAIFVTVGVLGAKLVDIQIVRADELQRASVNAKSYSQPLYGIRGNIVDEAGNTLAGSVWRYTAALSPFDANESGKQDGQKSLTKAVNDIGRITGRGGPAILALIQNALKSDPGSKYALVKSDMDVTMFDQLDKLNIPWLSFTKTPSRTYPNGAVAGNLIGFVSGEGNAQAGLELSENACLAGQNGKETSQLGADGVAIPGSTVVEKPAKNGGQLVTTLDMDLQWFSQQELAQVVPALGGKFGFVTVAEVKTGKLRAVAQYPSVDPNNVDGTPSTYWGALPFANPYEPGSTFKALTASALIDNGKATPETQVLAPYHFVSGHGADLHDSGFHDTERLTLTGVLMNSSNTGMSILGSKMDDTVRYNYLKAFGIGQDTGIGFPGESSGILHPVSSWDDQTKYATMFGQGVSATQIQMVGAYQALANGGKRIPLQLIDGCRQADGTMSDVPKPKPVRVISTSASQQTLGMMESVVQQGELSKQLNIPGYRVAAKTGTAQQPDGKGGYLPNYYVSVMGVAPVDDPQYVVSVNIGYPTTITSSAAAAPLFKTIMSQVLKTFRVKPSTTAPANYNPYY